MAAPAPGGEPAGPGGDDVPPETGPDVPPTGDQDVPVPEPTAGGETSALPT